MKIIAFIFLVLFFIGCGSSGVTQQTLVQDRIVRAPVPEIQETLHAVKHDTVIIAQKIVKNDTILLVKYFPKTNTMYVNIKPDSITILIHDTVQTFTGYTDNDLEAAKFKAYKWGVGCTIVFCAGVGVLLKLNKII